MMGIQLRTKYDKKNLIIWMDDERALALQEFLQSITTHKFIQYEGETFNTADIVGVFKEEAFGLEPAPIPDYSKPQLQQPEQFSESISQATLDKLKEWREMLAKKIANEKGSYTGIDKSSIQV